MELPHSHLQMVAEHITQEGARVTSVTDRILCGVITATVLSSSKILYHKIIIS